jgi:hypothetical protein
MSVTSRLNVTATPNLSLQLWAQPFVSTGTYSDRRALAAPRAADYEDRFAAFTPAADAATGFDVAQLRANTVLRWEYRPGSALFVVWQHGRQSFDDAATRFDFRRDYGDLLGLHPDNTFLVKFSYWLNP